MKKKIIIIGLIIIIVLIAVFIGIKANEKKEISEINLSLGSEPSSMDPAISLTIDVRSYLANLFIVLIFL